MPADSKGKTMRWICVLVAAGWMVWQVPGATAQDNLDNLSSEQLRRMYGDAVVQLKTAQDRRNELARENTELAKENEKLRAKIAQLEREVQQAQTATNAIADKTFQARAERAAFQEFLAVNPSIRIQWQIFTEKSLLAAPDSGGLPGADWPLPDKLNK
jgi:regulator of replication initiation timing